MTTQSELSEISRLLRNLIRTDIVSDVDSDGIFCCSDANKSKKPIDTRWR